MSVNIGPKIGIDGEAEYRKAIQNIIQQQKTLKSEMTATASAWDKDTSAQKKNAQQREILGKQIETQKDRVAELQNMLDKSREAYGENATQTQKWKQAVNEATAELNRMEQELKQIPNGIQQMGAEMQAAGTKISAVGDALMPISAAAAAVGVAAVKTTADFDSSMSKVAAISGATGDDFDKLRNKAREMGAETKFSASEAADAFTYMAMAGWKTEDMMNGIDGIMSLSAADGLDLATTSDIVTDALTAMGLKAEDAGHFADVLAAASTNANTNVEMMGETFKYAAPLAGSLGFNIEDLAVATGLMANSGIKGSQSGTALRGWLTRLAKPTKESSTAMEALGLSLVDSDGNMKSLMQVMEETRDAFQGLTEDQKAQYAAMLAGQNGMSGLLAITNATEEDMKKLSKATKNADGTAKHMAETMQDNLNGQMTILKSAAQEAAISVGDALVPTIRKGVGVIQDFTDWFNNLNDEQKQYAINAGIATAAAGPFFKILGGGVQVTGKVVEHVGGLVKAASELGSVSGVMNSVLGMTSVQLGLVAAPLVVLGGMFWKAGQEIDGMDDQLEWYISLSKECKEKTAQNTEAIKLMSETMNSTAENIQSSGADLNYWKNQLNNCYDSSGNLKEGMQSLAEYALGRLNEAMGTDYSTEFIAQANDSKAALDEISGAVDDYILKLKEAALQEAFSADYTQAIKNQADAQANLTRARIDYAKAQDGANQAAEEWNAAMERAKPLNATGGIADPAAVAALSEAQQKLNNYKDLLAETGDTLVQASENAAAADSQVQSLETTMETLGAGGADAVNVAAAAYANAGTEAQTAGEKAAQAAQDSRQKWEEAFQEKLSPPEIDQTKAAQNADTTTKTMQGKFDTNKLTAHVGGVDGAESAAEGARSAMQSFLDRHPIIASVVEKVTGGRVSGHADGGFVQTKQLSWLAEDGAEVVIPLSASKRSRALELFSETGNILGLGSSAYIPGSTTANSATYNTGGNTINVYGAPGQDVHELAEEISDIINADVQRGRAAWA